MNLFFDEAKCCGCAACQDVCPRNAIQMIQDDKGFWVPKINEALCVDCGLCVKTCPLQNQTKESFKPQLEVLAARHKTETIRSVSRSGGVFMAVAEEIIRRGGTVYGAALTKELEVVHQRAETFEECRAFQGSKYVQSRTQNALSQVKADLKAGRYVLYSGTGCQVDGLVHGLETGRANTEKLLTCDIVCHGNVSPKMFADYKTFYETKYHGKMTAFDFRDKSIGWATHTESFVINRKKRMKRGYTELYYCNAAYRECCYVCPYAKRERVGDFSLADCWGAEKMLPEMYDNKGISLVLVNSQRAKKILEVVSDKLETKTVRLEDFMQPMLKHPIEKSSRYGVFWDTYKKQGFDTIIKTFGKQNAVDKLKRWIRVNLLHR